MNAVTDIASTTLDQPPVLDDRRMLGHPRGLGLLFLVEMWERFSYYGMRAILVLYLTQSLQWSDARASRLYGAYTGMAWLTPLIGGYIADRFIGTRRSLVVGGLIIAAGHFCLAFSSMTTFYIGLVLIVIGTGFFKPNVSTMVGQMYRPGDLRRDSGFTIFYLGINVGAFLAPLVCGYLASDPRFGWHYGFAAAGVGMLLGVLTYLWGQNRYLQGIGVRAERASAIAAAGPIGLGERSTATWPAVLGAVAGALVAFLSDSNWLGYFYGALVGAALGLTLGGSRGAERRRVIALFIMFFFVSIFWMGYEQSGSSMTLFAQNHTRLALGAFAFPASWFQSVNPAFILLLSPVFATLWVRLGDAGRAPSTALKMSLGLILMGIGFIVLSAGARIADTGVRVSPWWLVGAYFFHTSGELCLSPVGLSYVTKVAPLRFASLLMGAWFLANSAGATLAGYTGALMDRFVGNQGAFFSIFVATSIGAGLLLFLLVPLLNRMTRSADGARA